MSRLCALLFALLCPLSVLAQDIPSNLRAAILMRALEYEKTFTAGSGPALILVLGGGKSGREASEMVGALRELSGAGGSGRKTHVEEVSAIESADELKKRTPHVVYVPAGNESALSAVAGLANVIVLCGDAGAVGKGCILSVRAAGGSPRLVIDVAAAERKGLTFDARLLRLAEVIR